MDVLAREALDTAVARGAGYADVRLLETLREDLIVKDGRLGGLDQSESRGIGVRVLVDGAWGYAATDDLTRPAVQACAAYAVAVGRASARVLETPVRLAPEPAHRAVWASPCAIDPFAVPLERKLDLLLAIDAALRGVKGVTIAESFLTFIRRRQRFLSSEGADIDQTLTRSGGGYAATAVAGGEV
jgi:TldD protein